MYIQKLIDCNFLSFSSQLIKEIMNAVTIPVMAKTRIGHFAEAQILEALGVDMIDESEGEGNTTFLELDCRSEHNC